MHHVSRIDPARAQTPRVYEGHSRGFQRSTYVDREMGSVHMGTGVCSLDGGGWINRHLHSFEESFYLLEGEVSARIGEKDCRFGPGDYGLIRTGMPHSWRNEGSGTARWLEMQAPQPRTGGSGRDTFFVAAEPAAEEVRLGHFDESQLPRPDGPSQMEGFNPTTGVAVKMFVDRSFGAIHQSLFLIQYLPGAKIDRTTTPSRNPT